MRGLLLLIALAIAAGCAPGSSKLDGSSPGAASNRQRSITIGVTSPLKDLGAFSVRSVGGWGSLPDLHSVGLITSGVDSPAPVGRLAESAPSVENDSVRVLSDGRMQVVYRLRHDVTWQDGTPFTAQDLAFSYKLLSDPGLPVTVRQTVQRMSGVEALDDWTAVFTFPEPFFQGGVLGLRDFWPQPRHLLAEAYDRYAANNVADDLLHLAYWTSAYVNLGPFQVTELDPGSGISLRAYDGYFLGRPRLDTIYVRALEQNALFAALLAGTIDFFPMEALDPTEGSQLQQRWAADGHGTVYELEGPAYFLSPQVRPAVQREPTVLDVRGRQALYQAIDRDALADRGFVQPAWSILPREDRLYEATRDAMRRYPFDPARARALLQELGWTSGTDGNVRHLQDGRTFQTSISTVDSGRRWEVAAYADAWRRIGIEVEEQQTSAAQARDLEFRASFPGWDATSAGQGDMILNRLQGPAASAANRWGGNRGGYEDPTAQRLLGRYYAGLSEAERLAAMHEISEFVTDTLPMLLTYYITYHVGVGSRLHALEDMSGWEQSYGTITRNAHLWDVA